VLEGNVEIRGQLINEADAMTVLIRISETEAGKIKETLVPRECDPAAAPQVVFPKAIRSRIVPCHADRYGGR
tara:strand:+ start:482 stop:697 length:216 start_codon:yes stop_codon:yes gene_type:complete